MPDIDVRFDFRTDTPPGQDPDLRSPTLRQYHQRLWSRRLPNGANFGLSTDVPGAYLHHRSHVGEFVLSSDAVIPTFVRSTRIPHIVSRIPRADRDAFLATTYTMGGMLVFPANKVAGKMTINGARGCHPRVKDRFDLTLECVRRFYAGADSPLADVLARYGAFFQLFGDFRGYLDFFLLQDLVTDDGAVRFFLPFEGFVPWPLPQSVEAYRSYLDAAVDFVQRRNQRIARLANCLS
jgi:hypothetical protein